MGNYIDDNKEKIQYTPGGTLCQVFGANEEANCSIALVTMDAKSNGLNHYHDNITEIYMFNKGEGKIIINGNENNVSNGDCFIIPPKSIHFIEAITQMEFVCICTPPWTPEHEFVLDNTVIKENVEKHLSYGVLQILSNENEHDIKRIKITEEYTSNSNSRNYTRVYYFIKGKGSIIIDNIKYKINQGNCFLINESSNEIIMPENELDFILVCDKLKR